MESTFITADDRAKRITESIQSWSNSTILDKTFHPPCELLDHWGVVVYKENNRNVLLKSQVPEHERHPIGMKRSDESTFLSFFFFVFWAIIFFLTSEGCRLFPYPQKITRDCSWDTAPVILFLSSYSTGHIYNIRDGSIFHFSFLLPVIVYTTHKHSHTKTSLLGIPPGQITQEKKKKKTTPHFRCITHLSTTHH